MIWMSVKCACSTLGRALSLGDPPPSPPLPTLPTVRRSGRCRQRVFAVRAQREGEVGHSYHCQCQGL